MKNSTVVGLAVAAIGLGAAAWLVTRPSAAAPPAAPEKLGCQPTPLQLDAFGKLENCLITISATNEKVGAHLEGATILVFNTHHGVLQLPNGRTVTEYTNRLCAYIRSPAGSPFNASAITRYHPPTSPLAAPKQGYP